MVRNKERILATFLLVWLSHTTTAAEEEILSSCRQYASGFSPVITAEMSEMSLNDFTIGNTDGEVEYPKLEKGLGHYNHVDNVGRTLKVWYYIPEEFQAELEEEEEDEEDPSDIAEQIAEIESEAEDEIPEAADEADVPPTSFEDIFPESLTEEEFTSQDVLFVMHGVLRNAKDYCKQWKRHADKYDIMIVCPQFSEDYFPRETYNLGHIRRYKKHSKKWGFSVIEDIFTRFNRAGIRRSGYHMYGHSAGGQFTHRFVMYMPAKCRLISAIAANPGWYTVPSYDEDKHFKFPYSLAKSPATCDQVAAFSRRLTVFLGQEDIVAGKFLRQTPEAEAQGSNRFERGVHFFLAAKAEAARLGCMFCWNLKTVPLVGHVNKKMAIAAAREFFGGKRLVLYANQKDDTTNKST